MERTKLGLSKDKMYKALGDGERTSKKVSKIRMSDGSTFKRKNANQYGTAEGGNDYTEKRSNRTDRFDLGGTADSSNSGANMGGTMGSSIMKDGGGIFRNFYEGQSIIVQQETSTKLDKSVQKLFNKFSNKELVIDKITTNKPYNLAEVFDRNTGEKAPFEIILNPKYVEQYRKGGNLIGKQKNLDLNKNGKLDSEDFKMIRGEMKHGGGTKSDYSSLTLKYDYPKFKRQPAHTTYYKVDTSKEIKVGGMGEKGYKLVFKDGNKSGIVITEKNLNDLMGGKQVTNQSAKISISDKYKTGGGVDAIEVGAIFYDTRRDKLAEIVSTNKGLISFKYLNKVGTEFLSNNIESLVKNQFDYLVNAGAYQMKKHQMAEGGLANTPESFPNNDAISYKTGGSTVRDNRMNERTRAVILKIQKTGIHPDDVSPNFVSEIAYDNGIELKSEEVVFISDNYNKKRSNGGATKGFEYTIGGL